MPQIPGAQSLMVARARASQIIQLGTADSGMCVIASVTCLTPLSGLSPAVISIRECQFISHHTQGLTLVLSPSQGNTACIKSERFSCWRWDTGTNLRVQKCPHTHRTSPGCRSRGEPAAPWSSRVNEYGPHLYTPVRTTPSCLCH